ncbi:MAG: cupin domain-containing protein [Spirochaetes bacterium]|nr:cupin domain-containing protein [Spirochaetota bacterium]
MPYIDFSTVPSTKIGKPFERELKILLSPDNNPEVRDFTLLLSTLAPDGGCTDLHTHDDGGELMIFMSGRGRAWLDGIEYELKPGVAIYAPPGVAHRTMNTGGEPLEIACIFVPAISTDYIARNIEEAKKARS